MQSSWYDRKTRRVRDLSCGDTRVFLEFEIRRLACRDCGKVKRERLDFLADNPFYTQRFSHYVGRRCRQATIKDIADELKLDWDTVKTLEKQYLRAQLAKAGTPGLKAIGIDEISIRNATRVHAPQAAILFDKFHIIAHLGKALDAVRKSEYARLSGEKRRFIKGQKYTLLSHRENLDLDGRRALKTLLAANKRLNTAYLLKESFGQLWDYERAGWARRFFENWRASLKWQRLEPYEKFAEMIDRHWDGIAAYCQPKNKVSLGFVEGLNNKIRAIQRCAYGLRDEEYLRLKILTCMLPAL